MRHHRASVAFVGYLAISVLFFALPVLRDPSRRYIGGRGSLDPKFFFWALAWWPHALAHGLNPFWTRAVWAPSGYNMAWTTGVPGPSLLVSPITATLGSVVSYNVLALLACPLAGWAAYLLCHHITGRFGPSLVGGYVFGFSTYQMGHVGSHVNLELSFVVPLIVYVVLLRMQEAIAPRRFMVLLTFLLVGQFLISSEVFATMAVLGAFVLAIALGRARPEQRASLLATTGLIGLAFVLTAVILSPYLYYVFAFGLPRRRLEGSDLLSFVLPTTRTLIGSRLFAHTTSRFPGTPAESTAYLGPPLLVVLVHFAVTQWRRPIARLLLACLALVFLATLGPTLYVNGRSAIALPWKAVEALPVINNAAPRRFTMYFFLLVAIILAIWLSSGQPRAPARWGLALLAPVFLFPSFVPNDLHGYVNIPEFFRTETYTRYLSPGENVLILLKPSADMVIQGKTDFYFRMVLGYTGPRPPVYRRSIILRFLYRGWVPEVTRELFGAFLATHDVSAIVLAGRARQRASELGDLLDLQPVQIEDVLLYRLRQLRGPSRSQLGLASEPTVPASAQSR